MSHRSASRLPDDHPAWKDLRPFGYECSRWMAAMGALQARWRKGRLGEPLSAFLAQWMPQEEVTTHFPETFELIFGKGGIQGDSASLADPRWQALLHLPALRDFWTAELRASPFAHLLKMIPQAWCMDATPLPPGAVISGLGISRWDELPSLVASGREFRQEQTGENQVVLVADSAIVEGWRARYTLRDGQISLQDAFLG